MGLTYEYVVGHSKRIVAVIRAGITGPVGAPARLLDLAGIEEWVGGHRARRSGGGGVGPRAVVR